MKPAQTLAELFRTVSYLTRAPESKIRLLCEQDRPQSR